MVKFYTDEQVTKAVAKALKRRGIDAITTHEAGMLGTSDNEQLAFAQREKRILFTQDNDFLRLHSSGIKHAGIVYSKQGTKLGDIIRGLLLIYDILDMNDMRIMLNLN